MNKNCYRNGVKPTTSPMDKSSETTYEDFVPFTADDWVKIGLQPPTKTNFFGAGGGLTYSQYAVLRHIEDNPRVLFTPEYSKWRDYIRQNYPKTIDSLFESLPYEAQQDIYINNRESFGALSNEAKGRYGAKITRNKSNEVSPYFAAGLGATLAAPFVIGEAAPYIADVAAPAIGNAASAVGRTTKAHTPLYGYYLTDFDHRREKSRYNMYGNGGQTDPPPTEKSSNETLESLKQFGRNLIKSPYATMYDTALWAADRLGAPSNVTNFLRDVPNAIRYKLSALPSATLKALVDFANGNGFTLEETYNYYLKNPSILQKMNTIEPLSNDNSNYSEEEMQIIKEMAGKKSSITNADIKRVSGRYGGQGSISSYVTQPDKVVQTSIGQSNGKNGVLHDIFDTNVSTSTASADNIAYVNRAKNDLGLNYYTLRAFMPYIGSTDIMPNDYKIHTYINLNH